MVSKKRMNLLKSRIKAAVVAVAAVAAIAALERGNTLKHPLFKRSKKTRICFKKISKNYIKSWTTFVPS